jgi:tetratricopeptide (TPR) repeat protein
MLLLTPTALRACLWDHDTLQMERSRFPSALELITGKFLRHSPEFYAWRVEDRKHRLENEPDNLALYDDLAVAYDKLGQDDKAIETMLAKDRKKPDQYETLANLATFQIHAGRWEESLPLIDKALAINPDAHFGREKYQKYLVRYALARMKDGKLTMPLARSAYPAPEEASNFYQFLLKQEKPPDGQPFDVGPALKGVMGMMRFARHDSPVLLEALGDLLLMGEGHNVEDAKRLAARAYLKASYSVEDADAKEAYRKRAREALAMQRRGPNSEEPVRVEDVEASFRQELADAERWYAELHARERGWIESGQNPEAEFDKLYRDEPSVASPEDLGAELASGPGGVPLWAGMVLGIAVLAAVSLAGILAVFVLRILVRRSRGDVG